MIVEIQCLPSPAGTDDNPHANVETAIAVVKESGLHHEVGPLGTSIEGEPDQIWPLLRRVHEACLTGTASSAISVIKVAEGVQKGMDDLTRKFR
jgi:uncharacterized protein YqgV (UPF0045/DUF77 family)